MKTLSLKASLYAPAAVSAGLSLLVMAQLLFREKHPADFGFIAPLICFLPVVFILVAESSSRYAAHLEARIVRLEQQLAEKKD